jgi:hypothetical protein
MTKPTLGIRALRVTPWVPKLTEKLGECVKLHLALILPVELPEHMAKRLTIHDNPNLP